MPRRKKAVSLTPNDPPVTISQLREVLEGIKDAVTGLRRQPTEREDDREDDDRPAREPLPVDSNRLGARKTYVATGKDPKMYPTTEKVLAYLRQHPNSTRAEISSGLGMNAGTVKFALRQLIQLGLVQVRDIK